MHPRITGLGVYHQQLAKVLPRIEVSLEIIYKDSEDVLDREWELFTYRYLLYISFSSGTLYLISFYHTHHGSIGAD